MLRSKGSSMLNRIISNKNYSCLSNHFGRWVRFSQNAPVSSQDSSTDVPKNEVNEQEVKPQSTAEDNLKIIASLQTENKTLVETVKSIDDRYKRALAETENVRRRMQRQIDDTKLFAVQNFCKDLLEVADILQLAKDSVSKEALSDSSSVAGKELKHLHEGIVMTESQLQKIFSKHGLVQCNPLGEKFDPNIHEAIFEIVDESKEVGTVAVVTKTGYLLHQRPVRPAKVGIVKVAP